MKVSFNSLYGTSFKGICTVGKDSTQRVLIANNIISGSKNMQEARKKAEILKETADIIAQETPDDAVLYIDYPEYYETSSFIKSILRYHQPIGVYIKGEKNDECIAFDTADSMLKINNPDYIKILSKGIINTVNRYYNGNIDGMKMNLPNYTTASSKEIKPVLNIIS